MKISAPNRDRIAQLCLWAALIGLLVRMTVRDSFATVAFAYYALPLVVIFGLLLVTAVVRMSRRKWMQGVVLLSIGLACLAGWFCTNYFTNTPHPRSPDTIRLLLWNIARVRGDVSRVLDNAQAQKPDIIAFIESGDVSQLSPLLLPADFHICDLGGGLTVLARGTITDATLTRFGFRNRIGTCTVHLSTTNVSIMVVDIDSNPFVSRETAMQKIELIRAQTRPMIILGDFNTPSDSVWFNYLRNDYVESFEAAGSGIHATWPSYLPLLAIDHIWVHDSLETLSSRLVPSFTSDHSIVLAEVSPSSMRNSDNKQEKNIQ